MTLSPDEQPLTRRQLRELERTMPRKDRQDAAKVAEEVARRAAESAAAPEPGASETVAIGTVDPTTGTPDTPTPAEQTPLEASESEGVEDAIVVDEPAAEAPVRSTPMDSATAPVSARSGEPVTSFAPEGGDAEEIIEQLVIDDVPIDDDPDDSAAHTEITVESLSSGPILAPIFQSPVEKEETPPAKIDDADATFDDLISSRTVGSTNSSTTSALVLPAVPNSMDMGTALDETGEVIITGSIDLPSSMGASGAPAAGIESNDLDALLEQGESEQVAGEVAPVSASRAVSTGASNNALVAPPKRGRANVPVVLAITAGVLAIGVFGLLAAAFFFRIF